MKHSLTSLAFSGLLAITAAACATMPGEPVATTQAGQNEALHALFARADEAYLVRNPVAALYRGDFRYADRLGDNFSLASFAAERAAAEENLAALRAFDRSALNPTDQIAYDVFEYYQKEVLAGTSPAILRFEAGLPVDHFRGFHINYPRLASAGGIAPFVTVEDYENNLKRHRDAVRNIDEAIARLRGGMANGVVHPRLTVELMIAQLDTQLALSTEQTPYWTPVANFPESFSSADRGRLEAAHRAAIEQQLRPALQRFRTFLANEYLPASRASVGLSAVEGGPDYYRHLVAQTTTLPLDPEDIHRIGLSEVARINAALAQARAEAGDRRPKIYRDKKALTEAWYDIAREVDPKLDLLFAHQPKTELEIRPYEEYREKFNLAASYNSGKPDGSRPGVFYFSGYDLANREVSPTVALYLHEGSPGHHFQNMIAAENEALPAFMRFGGNVAYGEGWGLYAESLGYEMGLYDDPLERIGALGGGEMLRAVRLVVDTGLHAKGWSRQQAIDYMVANGQPRDFATSEVARYIVMPGQALGYKIGELKIKELRKRAETALGDRFDVRAFHDQVLNTGSLPLSVLEAKIDRWIASQA